MEADAPRTTWQVAEDVFLKASTRQRLKTYARSRYGIQNDDSDDLIQETALELLHHESYVLKPDGYVFKVFQARCARFIAARCSAREVFASASTEPLATLSPEMLDRLIAFREAFEDISSRCRRLLCAYYIEGRSVRETAGDLSVQPGSVARLVSRCLRKLRGCIG